MGVISGLIIRHSLKLALYADTPDQLCFV